MAVSQVLEAGMEEKFGAAVHHSLEVRLGGCGADG